MSNKLSIVVPCFNEHEALPYFYEEIKMILTTKISIEWEIIFIDDGSKDKTLEIIRHLSKKDSSIRYVSFSRNFGKESAIFAGLEYAKGDLVAVMDADMQDPPSLLPDMIKILESEDYDSVAAYRISRKGEPLIRSFFARSFYKIINKISDADIVDGARDFRLMKRAMVDAILSLQEVNRFSKGIFGWVGFKTQWLSYENIQRVAGETKWSFWKLFIYSIEGITAFSTVPLAFASILGILFCVLSFVLICFIIFKTLLYGDPVSGWPSLACIILLVGGLQLFSIGILGQYLAKTYLETKNRPIYLVREQSEKIIK